MGDPLSAVASCFSIVSLSFQLFQSVQSISAFIKSINDAPAEIQRLAQTLHKLSALLQGVHRILERQESMPQMPLPEDAIGFFLEDCKVRVGSLEQLIDEFKVAPQDSAVKRASRKFKAGMKSKEIAELESQIHRAITGLDVALTLNNTMIQLEMSATLHAKTSNSIVTVKNSADHASLDWVKDTVNHSNKLTPVFFSRSKANHFYLKWLGVQKLETAHLMRDQGNEDRSADGGEQALYTEHEILWRSTIFGFGIRVSYRPSIRHILPAISTYPVVESILEFDPIIQHSTLSEIHRLLHTKLHPFTTDASGRSLIHVAALHCRPDVIELLIRLGDLPFMWNSYHKAHPISLALSNYWMGTKKESALKETVYVMSKSLHGLPEKSNTSQIWRHWLGYFPAETSQMRKSAYNMENWLWPWTEDHFSDKELTYIHKRQLIRAADLLFFEPAAVIIPWIEFHLTYEVRRKLERKSAYRMLNRIIETAINLYNQPCDVLNEAQIWLDILSKTDIDMDLYMNNELGSEPWDFKMLASRDASGGWTVGWDWVRDSDDPGHLLCTEFSAICCHTHGQPNWIRLPFPSNWGLEPWNNSKQYKEFRAKNEIRFNRRISARASKLGKFENKNISKSKMPGAWIR